MVKKISFLILSVAIMVIGIIGFGKLSYWDRSVSIFRFSSDVHFEGRMGRGHGGGEFEGREGPGGRGEFPGGKRINIRNVKWFLAVLASFTVFVIYIDKAICLIRRRKGRQETIKEIM